MFYYLNIVQLTITHFTMNLIKKKKLVLNMLDILMSKMT